MLILFHPDTASAMAQAVIARMDSGSGSAVIRFYKEGATGGVPTSGSEALTDQELVGTLVCSDPSATEDDGLITFGTITQEDEALVDVDGATESMFAIIEASDGTRALIVDVTDTAGDGFIKLNTTTIVTGGPIQLSALSLRTGNVAV